MFKLICVTNRKLCKGDFLQRVEALSRAGFDEIILREKDLNEEDYLSLYKSLSERGISVTPHLNVRGARTLLKVKKIHLSFPAFSALSVEEKAFFETVGVSCHSLKEAKDAEEKGASYLFAGHIFETDCKRGIPPRGTCFLREICGAVQIPVYAIGGIKRENIFLVKEAGASGACVMSGAMQCENAEEYFRELKSML